MDWFEKITGFRERSYGETQAKLSIQDGFLCSTESAQRFAVGTLETPTLGELRTQVARASLMESPTRVTCVVGDARELHALPTYRGALFQVASQFNLLEMVRPSITPEHGVTGYINDRTQGPACAIAAGAATIYRNYLVPIGDQQGQRAERQVDCLQDLRTALGWRTDAWGTMQNGYALCTVEGLAHIDALLAEAGAAEVDRLRALLRIGVHWNVRVTDSPDEGQVVSQAFCSALPVAYSRVPAARWSRFATLVLEAAYEATLLAGVLQASRGVSNVVMLTRLGGGAFGNDTGWINAAMQRALEVVGRAGLDVRIVCYGSIPEDLRRMCR